MVGMPEMQEHFPANGKRPVCRVRQCSRHLRTLPTSLWVGNAGAISGIGNLDGCIASNAGAFAGMNARMEKLPAMATD
jgi:hypothetical protein